MNNTISFAHKLFLYIQDTIEEIPLTEYEVLESKPLEIFK